MTFNQYNIQDDSATTLHDFSSEFPDAQKIWNEHEGDPDRETRYFAFKVVGALPSGMKIICYDRQEDTIVGQIDYPSDPNWVGMSVSGEFVVLGTSPIVAYDRAFTQSITMAQGVYGHCDVALDKNGRDVVCYHNHSHDWYSYSYLDTGEEVCVFHIEQWTFGGEHFSGNAYATPGWCAVSTYARSSEEGWNWQPSYWLDNAIFMMELTEQNPRIWRLSNARVANYTYWTDPMGAMNHQGTRFYWGSNWSDPDGPIDTYTIELPAGWWQQLQ
jgi:hypothetical protein